MKVPFLDLSRQYLEAKKEIDAALKKVFQSGHFVLGKELELFEKEFAGYCHRKFGVGVNSGTDALFLGLLSLGVASGDEVIVPAFTYIATALAATFTQAKPVFVDIQPDTYNINTNIIGKVITNRTKAIIPVHLFGQSADMEPILSLAQKYNLKIVEDAAQAHGAKYKISKNNWKITGSMGDIGCFSFYPTKNLGAFGDGGMIVTDKEVIYKRLLMLRDYGRKSRYEHVRLGYNSRLDTIQAAILSIKLRKLKHWNSLRRRNASIYREELKNLTGVILPKEAEYSFHVYHMFTIRVKHRDMVVMELNKKGIGSLIHYPIPLHLQKVYKNLGYKKGDFPVAEKVAEEIISLPMYPYLKERQIKYTAKIIRQALNEYNK